MKIYSMYFWTAPDGFVVVELRLGEFLTEARLRENLPSDIIEQKRYRVVMSPLTQCPTCKCPCNRYKRPDSKSV